MSEVIARLFVAGRPRTKGSLRPVHIKRGAGRCEVSLTEDHALSKPWLDRLIKITQKALGIRGRYVGVKRGTKIVKVFVREDAPPYAGAVEVHRFFRFQPDRSVAAKTLGLVVPSHDTPWPTDDGIGDVDKLTRSLLDALTQAGVLADDRLVVGGCELKRWCREGQEPGVEILVRPAGAWAAHVESIMLDGAP